MLDDIIKALRARADLTGWSVRHVRTSGVQLYAVPDGIVEAERAVSGERYLVELFREKTGPDGSPSAGSGNATLLPGDDIESALDRASQTAGLVNNKPYSIPGPGEYPDLELADPELQKDPAGALRGLYGKIAATAARHPEVRLTAAECFAEEQTTHLVNSRGIDATQVSTSSHIEFVLTTRSENGEVENFVEANRRRIADFDIEAEFHRQASYTADRLRATAPPSYSGAVVLRGTTLAEFIAGEGQAPGVIQMRSSASAKYRQSTQWEIGQSIFKTDPVGDPLTVWANRQLPYGSRSNSFDSEGLPAQRVNLIRDNKLVTFIASQRYADYLSIPATGEFGNVEMPPGSTPEAKLVSDPHIEIINFSWFNPSPVTGEFACEIRLGYLVDGAKRTPFKGGMLVGNVLDALANVRWSAETGFFGNYQGPALARFGSLTVVGDSPQDTKS